MPVIPATPWTVPGNSTVPYADQSYQAGDRAITLTPPGNLVAASGDTLLSVSWSSVVAATGYEVRIDAGAWQATTNLEYTFSGLTNSTLYTVDCRATAGAIVSANSTTTGTPAPLADWQLASTNYVPSKLTGRIVTPRPDAETSLNSDLAYYRRNHSAMTYRVRIGVKGMAWPLQYTLTTSPVGATIGSELDRSVDGATGLTIHTWGADYAIVEWASPTAGTETFTVLVTDQGGATESVTWTTTQDDTEFVFVDADSGSDAAAGTFAAPLLTFANGLWKNSDSDTTFAGKTAVFRGATADYVINAGTVNSSPILNTTNKPACFMAFPTEAPVFDTTGGHWRTSTGSTDDIAFVDIKLDGTRTDLGNNRLFNMLAVGDRQVFLGLTFANITVGTSGTDNPCCIGHFGNGTKREDIAVLDCTLESTVDTELWVGFDNNNVIIENNTIADVVQPTSNGSYGIHPKDDTDNITLRANVIRGTFPSKAIDVTNQNSNAAINSNQEVCWNIVVMTGDQAVDAAIAWNSQASATSENMWDYRNTANALNCDGYRMSANTPIVAVNMIGNVIAADDDDIFGTNYTVGSPANQSLALTDIDSNGKLTGTARTNYLGIRGGEVAG